MIDSDFFKLFICIVGGRVTWNFRFRQQGTAFFDLGGAWRKGNGAVTTFV